jgi:hypothetical protein
MMAHASRDPYWLAKATAEKHANPQAPFSVDAVCMRCHAPMQTKLAEANATPVALSAVDRLGEDGVSCMVCHQILPEGLGRKDTFTGLGRYSTDFVAFGPHAAPFAMPMMHHTGVTAKEGRHLLDAAFCSSCHTVITPSLNEHGKVTGEFLEQGPYLEWLASSYRTTKSCQGCHLPQAQAPRSQAQPEGADKFYIAHNPAGRAFPPTSPREPFGVHSFAGGNASMLRYLGSQPGAVASLADSESRTRQNLRRAALLRLKTELTNDGLGVQVTIRNLTGHKLPTGFPSRRMWVHLSVKDAKGKTLFESGALDHSGYDIAAARARVGGIHPHRDRITQPDEVAVFEAEMGDARGHLTHSLLKAQRMAKDNRILPAGFSGSAPLPEGIAAAWIAPVGTAGDKDFLPGSDTVTYQLPANIASGAHLVEAELLFQSIKPAHLEALTKGEVEASRAIAEGIRPALKPELLATASATLRRSEVP